MALNDRIRVLQNPLRLEIQIPTGTPQDVTKQGYHVLPGPPPGDPAATEFGSIWKDPASGKIMIHDAAGVRAL